MNPLIPGYLKPFLLTGSLAVLATLLFGLDRALKQAAWTKEERDRTFWSASLLLVGWYVVALVTAVLGFYRAAPLRIPTIQFALLIPIVLGVVLFRRWRMLQRLVEAVPNEWIAGVQAYRALGVIFLILYAGGHLPGFFAWPAGAGDVLVGLLAPVVAIAYARSADGAGGKLRSWNLLGVADLVVAVGTGFLTSPSRFQLVAFDRPNNLISVFPLVMIPAFLVPLFILLHLASLYKLRHAREVKGFPRTALVNQPSR